MKRFLAMLLALLILLCACGEDKESEKELTLGGITDPNTGLVYIDFDDPVITGEEMKAEVTLSEGTKGSSYMKIPVLNVDLKGANEVSETVKADLTEKYGDYFDDPDDRLIKVDYTTENINDMLVLLVSEEITTPDSNSKMTYSYYYDSLADTPLSIVDFSNYNGAQFATVYKAVIESDWAVKYEEETGNLPYEDVITALACKGDLLFTVYCTNPDGMTQTVLELQVEDVPLDFSGFEVQ